MYIRILFCLIASIFQANVYSADSSLIVGIPNNVTSLHPFETTTAQQGFILPLVYESLLVTEINGEIQPNLIKEWKIDEKEKSLTFKIRDNIVFSDGSKLTLDDVIESFKLICQNPKRSQDLNIIKGCFPYNQKNFGVFKLDNNVKILITSHPSYFLTKLASENILITKKINDFFIGTGPFKFKSLDKKELVLERNTLHRFWAKGSAFKEIHFVFIDESKIKSFIDKNLVHLASMYLTSTALTINNNNYYTINHAPNIVQVLVLNSDTYPFNNLKLRQKIYSLIKKESFLECSPGSRVTNGFIPEGVGGSLLEKSEDMGKDIELNDVKIAKKVKVKIHRHIGRANKCEEEKLKKIFSQFNLDMEVIYHKDYATLDPVVLDPHVEGFLELYVFKSRDASSHLKNMVPENKTNFYKIASAEIKKILHRAWEAKSLPMRFSYYKEINKMIMNNANFIDLYSIGHTNIIHKCLLREGDSVSYYNPNSFLFLLKLDFNSNCKIGTSL